MKKLSLVFLLFTVLAQAQLPTLQNGTVIKDYGKFFNIPNADYNLNPQQDYKVIFDIRKRSNDINVVNPLLDVVARFINLHVASGIPLKNLNIVVVFHGSATKEILSNKAYRDKFRKANPNLKLLKQLNDLGVKLYVCGQSATSHGISKDDVAKPVKYALSAMSVLVGYQTEGYKVIDFN